MDDATGGAAVGAPDDLTAAEARVLGCLIEKEATTPDAYPLTVNSLRNACNQSTSRDPVMSLTDRDVETALSSLRERGLTRTVHSTSNRATKFRHVVPDALRLAAGECALVAVLMLRGEQTTGELKSRCDRQFSFDSIDQVAAALADLAARDEPLVRQLERRPGQKDARWIHLLGGDRPDDHADGARSDGASSPGTPAGEPPDRSVDDPYGAATAEFYDLLATGHWDSFGLQLLDLLADVDASVGPIVDIGAGTGVGLPYLRAAAPDASILAIEPSRAMRSILHTRLHLDDDLRSVTTVDPRPWARAALPAQACALVMSAALGHLDDDDRARLWRFIAEQMPPGAPAVIEVLPPDRPTTVPRQRYRELPVGEFVYEGWQHGEPVDGRTMAWTMEYRVLDGDSVVAEYSVTSRYRCFGVDDIVTEVVPFGLTVEHHDDCVVITR